MFANISVVEPRLSYYQIVLLNDGLGGGAAVDSVFVLGLRKPVFPEVESSILGLQARVSLRDALNVSEPHCTDFN